MGDYNLQSYAKYPKGIRYREFLKATKAVLRPEASAREYILNLNMHQMMNNEYKGKVK